MMSIGTTIKKLRHERDITQEQLAKYLACFGEALDSADSGNDERALDVLEEMIEHFNKMQ